MINLSHPPKQYQLLLTLGELSKYDQEDTITCSKFSRDGTIMCIGDNYGRIIVFEQLENRFDYTNEIVAYNDTYDWIKNKDVSKKVKAVEWLSSHSSAHRLVSANDKFIKLWRIKASNTKRFEEDEFNPSIFPRVIAEEFAQTESSELCTFKAVHQGNISQLSLSYNQDCLLSMDGSKVLRWSLENTNEPSIAFEYDKHKNIMIEEDEAWNEMDYIQAIQFQPKADNIFMYSSKMAEICQIDNRCSTKHNNAITMINDPFVFFPKINNDYLAKYFKVVSDFKYVSDGFRIISRDFLNTSMWDLRFPNKPVKIMSVYQAIFPKMSQLIRNDYINDQFKLAIHPTNARIITPYYHGCYHEIDMETGQNHRFSTDFEEEAESVHECSICSKSELPFSLNGLNENRIETLNYHPSGNTVALTSKNCVSLFKGI